MKTVLIGVTGCIAAYKACEIVRGLQKADADINVKVVMTEHGTHFVGPTTFRALTGNEVAVGLFDKAADPIHHISLAKEADVFCIAPATANVISKIANGQADDLLTTTALATRAPLIIAPAMNAKMWSNEITQQNVQRCIARGAHIVAPGVGYLACGDEGAGRLEDPEVIVSEILSVLASKRDLEGKRVFITAGPTQEPLDPVRFISNHSSGITGYAIAAEAVARGAQVTLVSGPTALMPPEGAEAVNVKTACEMLDASREPFSQADVAIFTAAVSDWRPEQVAAGKIKHDGGDLELKLVPNPDVAATLGAAKGKTYSVVFAAETQDPIPAARKKLAVKNANLVVANNVAEAGMGMGAPQNHVWFVDAESVEELPVLPKREIARKLLDRIEQEL